MRNEDGFIALISILILSFVLLVAVLSLAQFGITSRLFLLDLENKSASEQLAAGCVQVAIIATVNDPLYTLTTPVPITIDEENERGCVLVSVTPNRPTTNISTIQASSTVSGATTNFEVEWDTVDEEIDSWREPETL